MPVFAIELARDRLSKRHFTQATLQARLYDPAEAVDAGFLDQVHAPNVLADEALAEARRFAEVPPAVYRDSKLRTRSEVAEAIRKTLHKDLARITGSTS